jgi:RNA polymerase sigma factor (sigma-70 family)
MIASEEMPVVQNNDAALVAESLEGRREAFRDIVQRYQSLICSLAYSATGSLSGSEDLAQETFVTAWKELPELREPAKLRSWLCGIARNLIGKALRRDGREPAHAAEPMEALQERAATEPLPPERAIRKEEEEILWRSLEQIPEAYREPLVLFYREHQSVEKVAAALDLTEEAVRQRLSRGRRLLHEQVLAFVEGALEESNPGKAFTVGVLAALPLLAASATAASAATAGGVAAKGGATAKTITTATALGTALTAGVICFFSFLGFLAFLGGCIGYIMGRAIRRSAWQLEYVTRFWRALAGGFGALVVIPLLVGSGLRLSAGAHPALYHAMTLWVGLIYLAVPTALGIWLWRWWRESAQPAADAGQPVQPRKKRFFVWFALGLLVPTYLLALSLYSIAFEGSLNSERLSGGELQRIVTERKDAEFRVTEYQNGSKSLSVTLPESRRRVTFVARADEATLALLAANHVAYKTCVAGQDFEQLGAPARLLLLLGFFLTPAGATLLLMRPWRPVLYLQQQQTTARQPEKADPKARNAFRAFAAAVALALVALAVFFGLITRWGTRTVSSAGLPSIIAEHKLARYSVCEYDNGSKKLHITPHNYGVGPFVAPADAAALALLKERGIPYDTLAQGRDFGHADPTPLFSGVCIALLTTAALVLLWLAAKGLKPSPPFSAGFLIAFGLAFGASIFLSRTPYETYISTARVQVAEWSHPGFPQDETGIVESKEVLDKVIVSLDLSRKWGRRWAHGAMMEPDQTTALLKRFVWADPLPLGRMGAIDITVYDNDRGEATTLANAIADTYCSYRNQARAVAHVLDAAVPDQVPLPRFKPAMLVIGGAVGVLLGLVAGATTARVCAWRRSRQT